MPSSLFLIPRIWRWLLVSVLKRTGENKREVIFPLVFGINRAQKWQSHCSCISFNPFFPFWMKKGYVQHGKDVILECSGASLWFYYCNRQSFSSEIPSKIRYCSFTTGLLFDTCSQLINIYVFGTIRCLRSKNWMYYGHVNNTKWQLSVIDVTILRDVNELYYHVHMQ